MSSIKEVTQRVQSLYSKGTQSDDSRLTIRHIYSKLSSLRAKLFKQKLDKKQKVSDWSYQTIDCVELVLALPHECPCIPPIGCKVYRSKYPIPSIIYSSQYPGIDSVTSIDGGIVYTPTTWKAKKYKKADKYTSQKPDYFFRNDYLYLTHKPGPKVISITALFEDVLDVTRFTNLCQEDCVDCNGCIPFYDVEFNIEDSLLDTIIELAVPELIEVFSKMREDQTNDNKDSRADEGK